jgi:chemotaxis protein MotB
MIRKKYVEEKKKGAPAFIVTFSDMITLLLTFFVMLLSLASEQCVSEKFKDGQTSFKDALAGIGLQGFMIGGSAGSGFDNAMVKYKVNQGEDETEDRTPDAETEMLRGLIQDIERMMKISPAQIKGGSNNFTVADIHFTNGSWSLDNNSKDYLTRYCNNMQQSFFGERPSIYIVGLAADEGSSESQFRISARRAQSVADFITSRFTGNSKWPIFCWGSGGGGDWTNKVGMISKEADIMIAILSNNR